MECDTERMAHVEVWEWIAEFATLHFGDNQLRVSDVVLRRERRIRLYRSMFHPIPVTDVPDPWRYTIIACTALIASHSDLLSSQWTGIDDTPASGGLRFLGYGSVEVHGLVDAAIGSAFLPKIPPA